MKAINHPNNVKCASRGHLPSIDICRMLLLLGVVAIHCNIFQNNFQQSYGWASWLVNYLSSDVFGGCVPVFFMISGFLYFRNCEQLSLNIYRHKVISRIKTLLVPYLLWNLIGSLIFIFKEPTGWGLNTTSMLEYLRGFIWGIGEGGEYPYDFVMWFIRNLIVFTFIAPLGWWIGKYTLVMVACTVADIFSPFNTFGFLYFTIGCWAARHEYMLRFSKSLSVSSWILLITSSLWLNELSVEMINTPLHSFLILIRNLSMCGASMSIALVLNSKIGAKVTTVGGAVFFIYAFHGLYCSAVRRTLISAIGLGSSLKILLVYACSFVILIAVSYAVYRIVKWLSPRATELLTGFRK